MESPDSTFQYIRLLPEQEELLTSLVEFARALPKGQRSDSFYYSRHLGGSTLFHESDQLSRNDVVENDLLELGGAGLITLNYQSQGLSFYIKPTAYDYYAYLKKRAGQPIQQVEQDLHSHLDSEPFRREYPSAYQKWTAAAENLWASENEQDFTTIGHLCRETIQEFAAALVGKHQPPNPPTEKNKDIAKIKAVLNHYRDQLSDTESDFLDALVTYWVRLSQLVQRQEHGGSIDKALLWEDARRVVFHTAIVMFEVDRSLARQKGA
ncbi:MAG TPA: hypothetical protein VII06_36615 [Chloroflexota bacterium]